MRGRLAACLLPALLLGAALVAACGRGTSDTVRIEPYALGPSQQGQGTSSIRPYQLLSTADPALERVVRTALGERIEHYSVVVKELEQGTGVAVNADRTFYAASLFKLAVMY